MTTWGLHPKTQAHLVALVDDGFEVAKHRPGFWTAFSAFQARGYVGIMRGTVHTTKAAHEEAAYIRGENHRVET